MTCTFHLQSKQWESLHLNINAMPIRSHRHIHIHFLCNVIYYMVNHAVSTICRVRVHTVQVSAIITSVRLKVLVESELLFTFQYYAEQCFKPIMHAVNYSVSGKQLNGINVHQPVPAIDN